MSTSTENIQGSGESGGAHASDDLLEVARATGLRQHMHGINAPGARLILQRFVGALRLLRSDGDPPTVSATVPDGWRLVPQTYIDAVKGAAEIASAYSPCIDKVEEDGGDDAEDPTWAIHHRLYYAAFALERTPPTSAADAVGDHHD